MDAIVSETVASERKRGGRTLRPQSNVEVNTETWLSGRKHLTANEAGSKSPRRFKSSRLRDYKNVRPSGAPFLFAETRATVWETVAEDLKPD